MQGSIGSAKKHISRHAYDGDVESVMLDIKRKHDVNTIEKHIQATPLTLALMNEHDDVVDVLIAAKADVNLRIKPSGNRPILYAAMGSLHSLRAVLAAGATQKPTCSRDSPILRAAQRGLHANMLALIENNRNVALKHAENRRLDNEETVFMGIFTEDSPEIDEITQLLLKKFHSPASMLAERDDQGRTVLHFAAKSYEPASSPAYAAALRRVIALMPPSALNACGGSPPISPLALAAERIGLLVAEILLEAGADPNFDCGRGHAPLVALSSSWMSNDEAEAKCARMLVAAKADVNACDGEGRSAVELAVKRKALPLARVLVGLGAKPVVRGDAEATKTLKGEQKALVAAEKKRLREAGAGEVEGEADEEAEADGEEAKDEMDTEAEDVEQKEISPAPVASPRPRRRTADDDEDYEPPASAAATAVVGSRDSTSKRRRFVKQQFSI
jgi:ankyrin repeat protein